jgi:hypothetical protein
MKKLSTFCALILLAPTSFSQETNVPKRVTLKVMVKDSIHRVDFGYLAGMTDSTIVVVKARVIFDHAVRSNSTNTIAYQNLSEVSINRKGRVGRGMLFGAVGGMFVGAIAGYISYKPVNCEGSIICFDFGPGYSAATGASVGVLAGAMVGGIIGALAKKTFVIGGNKNRFAHMKENVLDMTYRK